MFGDKFGLRKRIGLLCLSAVMSGLLAAPVLAQTPNQVFMRYPTIHGESVVFEACGNLWLVDRKGGPLSVSLLILVSISCRDFRRMVNTSRSPGSIRRIAMFI